VLADFAHSTHRVECLGDNFGSTGTTSVVRGLRFEEFGAGEDHSQLIAEAVK